MSLSYFIISSSTAYHSPPSFTAIVAIDSVAEKRIRLVNSIALSLYKSGERVNTVGKEQLIGKVMPC